MKGILFYIAVLLICYAQCIVPQPRTINLGENYVRLTQGFQFTTNSSSELLRSNLDRYHGYIFDNRTVAGDDGINSVSVLVETESDALNVDTDESYTILMDSNTTSIVAKTVYGAKHALESFSQLVRFNHDDQRFEVPFPIRIMDVPRFQWRGFLLDTSRHYMQREHILMLLRGMEAVKLNVFHWHIVDAQSFPLYVESVPELAEKGAYDTDSIYNKTFIQEVVNVAKSAGIRVVIEVDIPGHAASWGKAFPNITVSCPSHERNVNNIPLDPTESFTYDIIEKVFTEVKDYSDEEYIHTGGDEVVFSCYRNNTKILKYMRDHGITDAHELAHLFEQKLDIILERLNRKKIIWEDMRQYGAEVNPETTLIHFWKGEPNLLDALKKGFQVIYSNGYYLNPTTSWETYYNRDYVPKSLTPEQRKRLLGGEAAVWAEMVSSEVLNGVVWPKTAAIAERLWSEVKNADDFAQRVKDSFTCHLSRRNVDNYPLAPGHCSTY